MKTFTEILGKEILFFDGGTGSLLQAQGLKPGELPETWNILHPEKIVDIHYNYYLAGANIIKTNTFGANPLKFPLKNPCTDNIASYRKPQNTYSEIKQSGDDIDSVSSKTFFLETLIDAALKNANTARQKIHETVFSENTMLQLKNSNLIPQHIDSRKSPHFIAFDIGPLGKLFAPLGDLPFEEGIRLFSEVFRIALHVHSQYPFDLILIETINDCYEAKAAVIAAKEVMEEVGISLPVIVTTVYDQSAKSLTGSDPETMVTILEGLGVAALGMNCSLGPKQMTDIVPRLTAVSSLPVVVNPNAGLPHSQQGHTIYDVTPANFATITSSFVDMGASLLGGCCGTTPEHICRLVNLCKDKTCSLPYDKNLTCVSSYTKTMYLGDKPLLIGERINPTGKKRFKQALRENDIPYILREGLNQEEKGVHILDVNVGLPEIDETQMLETVVRELQSVTELPLQLDTSHFGAMEKALRIYNGKALVNSVNGKKEVMDKVFPLIKKYGGVVVALTLDENGIPDTVQGRLAIAEKIFACAQTYGISKKNIIVDPLAMAISADTQAAAITLDTLDAIHKQKGRTILGVSNISFGLPQRDFVTAGFFTMAMERGLSAAIMNPNSTEMMKAYFCFCTLRGYDPHCSRYIEFVEEYTKQQALQESQQLQSQMPKALNTILPATFSGTPQQDKNSLQYAIIRGLKKEAQEYTQKLLQTDAPLDIINNHLIPALDHVGKGFEAKTLFLPQLLMSAEAAKEAFKEIKTHLAGSGTAEESKGTIVLATVRGDIHDIGKNIVKVLLENYSFTVIDLGKDVPPEKIAETVCQHHIYLVGLSALMTTTVPYMEETIKLLRKEAPWCKVCVGGAVMTEEYAHMIDADFYGKDALDTVKFAQNFFTSLQQ